MRPRELAALAVQVRVDQRYIDAFVEDIRNFPEGSQAYRTAMRLLATKIAHTSDDQRRILTEAGVL